MQPREWALVVFTVVAQLSVGAWLAACVAHVVVARAIGFEPASRLLAPAALAGIGLFAIAMAASLFHLGAPVGAPMALGNLGSSWLSREILAALVFGGALAVAAASLRWRPASVAMVLAPGLVAAVAGAALIGVMARLYRLQAQPAWDTIGTPISFLLAVAVLGGAAAAAWMTWRWPEAAPLSVDPLAWNRLVALLAASFSMVAAVALGFELIVTLVTALGYGAGASGPSGLQTLLSSQHVWLFVVRMGLVVVGAGLSLVVAYRLVTSAWVEIPPGAALLVMGVVLAEELAGRHLFYLMRSGLGL